MVSHDDLERRREMNEGVHPRETLYDEEGEFAVRTVFLDGVDRTESRQWKSLRGALDHADEVRADLKSKGYDRHRVHVGVIDENDPERGELDWDDAP